MVAETLTPSQAASRGDERPARGLDVPRSALGRALDLCQSPSERALIVVGEAGSGKTTLLDRVHVDMVARSVLVRANPGEVARPLSGFSAVFSAARDRRLVELGSRLVLSSDTPDRLFDAARDVLVLLRGMDLDPVVLLIDDIDRMDQQSQLILGHMAGRLNGTGLRVVATARRVDEDDPLAGISRAALESLDARSAVDVARAHGGARASESTLALVAARSDGNPRAISHLVRGLSDAQVSGHRALVLPLPPDRSTSRIVEGRLRRLTRAEVDVLTHLACAPVADAPAVRGLQEVDEDLVDALARNGWIETEGHRLRLNSHLVRAHLYASTPTRRRRELHRLLAQAHRQADPGLAVYHDSYLQGGEAVARALMRCAADVCREGRHDVAVELAERALCMGGDDDEVAASADVLAGELLRECRPDLAYRYLAFAMDGRPVGGLSADHVLTRIYVNFAHARSFPHNNIAAWIALNTARRPQESAEVLANAAWYHALTWNTGEAVRLLREAEPLMGGAPSRLTSFHHSVEVLADAMSGWASRADLTRVMPRPGEVESLPANEIVVRASSLMYGEDYTAARSLCSIALNVSPSPFWERSIGHVLATTEFRAGRFFEGRMVFEAMARGPDAHAFRPQDRLMTARCAYAEDRLDDALAVIDAGATELSFQENQQVGAGLLALKGTVLMVRGEYAQTVRVLHLADRVGAAYRNPALLRHAGDLVEACVRTGATREAHEALQRLTEQSRAHPSRWAQLVLARSRAIAATPEKRGGLFDEALDLLTPEDSPYERGRTHLALGTHLESAGAVAGAEESYAAAAAAFQEAGTLAWVHRIDQLAVGSPSSERDGLLAALTPEELDVVELVRLGHSNKSIAAILFVSVRTVELRLTRTYRKLGAHSRLHLLTLLGEGRGVA